MLAMERNTPRRALSCAILLLLSGLCLLYSPCIGKEVELTSEWTLIGENDTVPAGAHIRMDMTTGEKWVKLVDEDDQGKDVHDVAKVQVDASGGLVAVSQNENKQDGSGANVKGDDLDYEMMHRTLLKLPHEEQERMGGLPELPGPIAKVNPETRKAFELRMKEIWIARQAELAALQHEFLADLPKLLLERIRRLDSYLQDPHSQLIEDWTVNAHEQGVSHIVSVLQDLEYHLSDVDMARDFHTLGGWPLLVSLLSDNVHQSYNKTMTPELMQKVQDVQANAAWAIGSATKNIGEFAPFALEELYIDDVKTTPIELLLAQMHNGQDEAVDVSKKHQKIVYALGSLLRGNRLAQEYFVKVGGPAVLGQILADATDQEAKNVKLAKRILALADDIVLDVVLHEQTPDKDAAIIEAFSKDEWCQSALILLEQDEFQEKALQFIKTMTPHCQWDKEVVRASLARVKAQLEAAKDDADAEHLQEQMEVADAVLTEL